ncbi:CDGSH iron-sulfur domain-containing protein 2 homolog [Pseudomyrmex gracilis]|uniref:CDGSH iron-sulfur domain-containing protein 2 homolog n=1 Tax=Pseudomyrmex gracilis TaxID=219809 RepID=UPI0009955209|nr:CDGSH iron-sulfur domain-containing protein 2 homolog [Pseudomyrmex gracilis]
MEPIARLVKVSVPNYLAGLPIPDSIGGWFRLGVKDWLALLPPTALLVGVGYMSYRAFCPHGRPSPCGRVNRTIKKDVAKVVDEIDIEDIDKKAVFCRCWRTENWPYCDGSHGCHNKEHGDNVGPLIISRS